MRTIPVALMDHLETARTSICLLTKVKCKDGTLLAFTTLDTDVTFDDGGIDGPILYSPLNGFTPSEMVWSGDLSVDTAEAAGWIRDTGITEQQIRSGIFDHARFWCYRVNFLDLADGYWIASSGTTGETRFTENGFIVELRSKSQALKQPLGEAYLLTCTVAYGSPPCGKSFEWFDFQVATVDGTEPDRIFSVNGDSSWPGDDRFGYGVVEMLTGNNAGAQVEVEVNTGNDFELLLPFPYPLVVGDQGQVRIDCNKVARDTVYGCKAPIRWGADWVLHHRGFPDIPVARQGSLQVPGAETPTVPGGTVSDG